ncbi:serpin B4-like isoform X2 [Oppia nitens]|uniref:serpin B4-like isoform X2 n=1 Tax=Oppia nitens TaxID=1686743 RepID=UPI0023DA0487|nr:serpin B4-like isoform X2 [Oppia nitens]
MIALIILSILLTGLMASNSTQGLDLSENLVIQSNNEFSFRIYNMLAKDDNNDIISSFSIISALSILMNGANYKTLDNLKTFLGFQNKQTNELISDQTINNGFQTINGLYENKSIEYKKHLNETQEDNRYNEDLKHQLNIANLVVRNDSEVLKQKFVDAIQLAFRAQVDRADFKHNAVAETDKINQWIRKQTNNKIQKIFDIIDGQTSLILLNAVYFKSDWEGKFKQSITNKSVFYNNGHKNSNVSVDTMFRTGDYFYFSSQELNSRLIELPYKGSEMSFVIILPNDRNGLSTLKTRINAINFDKAFKSVNIKYVKLFLPKFKSEKEYDLMKDINPKPIALTTGADLSRLSTSCDQTVTQIRHKTFISVDEEGTEAVAVTPVETYHFLRGFKSIVPPIEFRVDHPFLYYIIDKTNGMIMFSGQINKL